MPQPVSTVRSSRSVPVLAGLAVALVIIAAILSLFRGEPRVNLVSSTGSAGIAADMAYPGKAAQEEGMYAREPGIAPSPMPPAYPTAGETAADVDQRVIKNGSLRLTVDRVSDAINRITGIATSRDGFVQSSSASERGDGSHDGEITIRVPSAQFEAAMQDAKAVAKVVNYESSTGQDVTEQYTDLEAQLRNAKAQETEFLRILQRANTVQDILAVQSQLGQVRSTVEMLEGRLKYLENLTSYSTISVALTEETVVTLPTKEFRPGAVVRESLQQLILIGQAAVAFVIWAVIVGGGTLLPLGALVGLGWLVFRRFRR